jgi:hypothetical protein
MRVSRQIQPIAATAFALALFLGAARPAQAQHAAGLDALQQLNGSVATLVARVSQSVVQVLVTSYGPVDEQARTDTDLVIGHQTLVGRSWTQAATSSPTRTSSATRRVEVVLPGRSEDGGVCRWSWDEAARWRLSVGVVARDRSRAAQGR